MTRTPHRLVRPVVVLLIALNAPVYSWNARSQHDGSAVAYDKLSQKTQALVYKLLMLNSDFDNWLDSHPSRNTEAPEEDALYNRRDLAGPDKELKHSIAYSTIVFGR